MRILNFEGEFDNATIRCEDLKTGRTITWCTIQKEGFVLDNMLNLLDDGFKERVIKDNKNKVYVLMYEKEGYDVKFHINVYAK